MATLVRLFFLATCVRHGAAKKNTDEDNMNVSRALPHHSFQAPFQFADILDDWVLSGASLAERERLVVHPPTKSRYGFAFNKEPLMTNNFEVIVQFRWNGEKDMSQVALDQALAVWVVTENISATYDEKANLQASSWEEGMKQQGFTLVGGKAKVQGFAAVLSNRDASGKAASTVTGVVNDGTKENVFGTDVPSSESKPFDFRNTLNTCRLRLRFRPHQIKIYMKQSPSLSYVELFRFGSAETLKPGGYIGLTAFSGTTAKPDSITVLGIETNNFDETSLGEQMRDVTDKIQSAYREMLMDKTRHFMDQKSQSDHLARLTSMLSDYAAENDPKEQQIFENIMALQRRMAALRQNLDVEAKEIDLFLNKRPISEVKNHIIGIRHIFTKGGQEHHTKISTVQKNLEEVKEISKKGANPETLKSISQLSDSLEKTVATRSSHMSWMLFALLFCATAIGYLIYSRMKYYEKKHFL